jgi:predicted kinase
VSKLVLVRGIPGSGKSTVASAIGYSSDWMHLETDMFWMENGEYKFDVNRLREAHEWCQAKTREYLTLGMDVVVSNTFTTIKELRPYFDIAREFSIVPQVITCHAQYGNVHDVPEETLAKMRARFVYDIKELYENMGN